MRAGFAPECNGSRVGGLSRLGWKIVGRRRAEFLLTDSLDVVARCYLTSRDWLLTLVKERLFSFLGGGEGRRDNEGAMGVISFGLDLDDAVVLRRSLAGVLANCGCARRAEARPCAECGVLIHLVDDLERVLKRAAFGRPRRRGEAMPRGRDDAAKGGGSLDATGEAGSSGSEDRLATGSGW